MIEAIVPDTFEAGGFFLTGSAGSQELRHRVGGLWGSLVATHMSERGEELWETCALPTFGELPAIPLAMFRDSELTDLAGVFIIVRPEKRGTAGNVVKISAMASPAFPGYPTSDWFDSTVDIMKYLLYNDMPCEDGMTMRVIEWRFAQLVDGTPAKNLWPDTVEGREDLISASDAAGLVMEIDNDLFPIALRAPVA